MTVSSTVCLPTRYTVGSRMTRISCSGLKAAIGNPFRGGENWATTGGPPCLAWAIHLHPSTPMLRSPEYVSIVLSLSCRGCFERGKNWTCKLLPVTVQAARSGRENHDRAGMAGLQGPPQDVRPGAAVRQRAAEEGPPEISTICLRLLPPDLAVARKTQSSSGGNQRALRRGREKHRGIAEGVRRSGSQCQGVRALASELGGVHGEFIRDQPAGKTCCYDSTSRSPCRLGQTSGDLYPTRPAAMRSAARHLRQLIPPCGSRSGLAGLERSDCGPDGADHLRGAGLRPDARP